MLSAVVDGSNVAHERRTPDGQPRVDNLTAVRDELQRLGFEVMIIVDAALAHQVDDPEELERLIDADVVKQAPAETDADYFILEQAEATEAIVVSNDRYRDRTHEYPWIEDRRVPVMILDGRVELYEPRLGQLRKGLMVTKASEDSFPASDPPAYG